jgi:hypothetical protein
MDAIRRGTDLAGRELGRRVADKVWLKVQALFKGIDVTRALLVPGA